jgi:indolepyruvate ferredoxin oxidoreductase, alpha subunit
LRKLITGNEAVAFAALAAGVKTVSGYPGTPSTGALAALLTLGLKDTYVEWSTNEKVAMEIGAGSAWAGKRALVTMKMSGVNVAADSLWPVAYSGVEGALVIYVADDPGVSAGCVEQDTRQYAAMFDLPVLEPATVAEAYSLTKLAFELSEQTKTPVIVRSTTAIASSFALVEVEDPAPVSPDEPRLIRDIQRFTKAGAAISMAQHRDVIHRLEMAGEIVHGWGLNRLELHGEPGGVGLIACGITAAYLDEAFEALAPFGVRPDAVSQLVVTATHPFPTAEAAALLAHCQTVVVLEELEPHIERQLLAYAQPAGYRGQIRGKLDGLFSRVGEYGVREVARGIAAGLGLILPEGYLSGDHAGDALAAARPITVCAGCPHRGTYMAVNQAIKKLKLKPDQVMVTGDIGCTILGMNPPFNTVWNEVSMGASVSLAQGFLRAGVKTPVIATIGDSTFFHGGMPGLVNAIQHNADLTLIVMDNLWTAMTGMQINPGTPCDLQQDGFGATRVDLARIIPALGVEHFFMMDPFDLDTSAATVQLALKLPGVKVILSRRECAIPAGRRDTPRAEIKVVPENCNLCKLCLMITGCSALGLGETTVTIDDGLCVGCGLCVEVCNREALLEIMP